MPVSISVVRGTQPAKLVDAAAELGRTYTEVQTVIAGERETLSHLQDHWKGAAAEAAIARGLKDIAIQERTAMRLQQLQSALQNAGLQMGALRDTLLDLVSSIEKMGFSVADDGTVTPHQWLIGRFLDSIARNFTTVLEKILELFTDLDENTAAAIDQADGPNLDNPTVTVGGQDVQIPSMDTAPADVKQWWDSLTDQQRQELIAKHPPILGNLNGLPAEVRDKVNVAVMDDDLDRVENTARQHGVSVDDVKSDPGRFGLSSDDVTRYDNAKRTQDGLLHQMGIDGDERNNRRYSDITPQERLDRNLRPTMLWAYEPTAFDGKGRAAVSIGNPDKSPNTAVIVPGTGSSVRDGWLSDGHNDARNLYDQSLRADPNNPTAVMSWMGYDTPESFTDPNIATPGLARTGGDALAWDVNSFGVTHDPSVPQHTTVIGHSYGSTTVADAFARSGMQANDAVLLGCPGTDAARSAADFHLNGGQVYVGDASTDPVGMLGEAGPGLPNALNDKLGNMMGVSAGLGTDPAGQDFGSVRFRAEVVGADGIDPADHSNYYTVGSESLRGITDIASGNADRLATDNLIAEHRHPVTVSTPREIDVPVIGKVPIPGVDVQTPIIYDPEWDRENVTNDHSY
ncbi:alpha/beta hydrolase [Mycolicibacterium sp. 018/SC-01/001]|uniref:alpha/beta hydrolase n=1 Tax=Mycolicibacterium sp. 018/SC-01/001 TaxID=2592069 RepID=UPI00117FD842|nr:alpha/beta hydrolase [Mycolicibacterium sp. 018/SC-01/001]TRW78544.1 alpha/beta hydrolase [Mycolicibacterium sp. 018/SC-01/001]